jgi:ethanolamine utilization microcompartment shell protein EutL
MHQIFISVPMEAGKTVRGRDASKSEVVRVLGGANWADVKAAIGVTIRQAKGMRG